MTGKNYETNILTKSKLKSNVANDGRFVKLTD